MCLCFFNKFRHQDQLVTNLLCSHWSKLTGTENWCYHLFPIGWPVFLRHPQQHLKSTISGLFSPQVPLQCKLLCVICLVSAHINGCGTLWSLYYIYPDPVVWSTSIVFFPCSSSIIISRSMLKRPESIHQQSLKMLFNQGNISSVHSL